MAVSGAYGGLTQFQYSSSAGDASIISMGGTMIGALGGEIDFFDTATAGNATITLNGATASGGGGGYVYFLDDSTGGTSHIQVFGNGFMDISDHNAPGLTIGSLEGTGIVSLGGRQLIIGAEDAADPEEVSAPLDTIFSGTIQDAGDSGESGGSIRKIGTGTLTLDSENSYTGGTIVDGGTLVAAHDGALGGGDVSLTTSGATLTLQDGTNNTYFGNTAALSVVTDSLVNLNFTGTLGAFGTLIVDGIVQPPGVYGAPGSGAPNELPQFGGMEQVSAVLPVATSRKTQGGAGDMDIFLPLTEPLRSNAGAADRPMIIRLSSDLPIRSHSLVPRLLPAPDPSRAQALPAFR